MTVPLHPVFRTHIIEGSPGDPCLCGHPSTHHNPPAFPPRVCGRPACGCVGYISEVGRVGYSRPSTVSLTAYEMGALQQEDIEALDAVALLITEAVPSGLYHHDLYLGRRTVFMHPLTFFPLKHRGDVEAHSRASLAWQLVAIQHATRDALGRLYSRKGLRP